MGGVTAAQVTQEQKDEFVELLYAGLKGDQAATAIGTTGTVMKRVRSPKSRFYDPQFDQACRDALASEEHRLARQEKIRAMVDERAEVSDNILAKLAMVELPEWEPLRHQNFRHDISLRVAAELLPNVPSDMLDAAIEHAEHELKPARPALAPAPEEDVA